MEDLSPGRGALRPRLSNPQVPESAAICVMDRAYVDFERLFAFHQAGAFFVTRAKSNADFRRIYSRPSDREQGIICDQTVALSGFYSQKSYPLHLRRIRFKDIESGKTLIFVAHQATEVGCHWTRLLEGHDARCIRENEEPAVGGDAGLTALRVLLAVYESAQQGRSVAV